MPIVDIEYVTSLEHPFADPQLIADALGNVLGSQPGHTWVRMRRLDKSHYAENEVTLSEDELPVFVIVLLAHPPVGAALEAQIKAVTQAVAHCCAKPLQRVHVQYAPSAVGRQAFGGQLVV